MPSDLLPLNTHFLVRRLALRELTQGWVAREIGVDRKTVNRWATGRVKRIDRENAERLAAVLACSVADLTLGGDADVLATRQEQSRAAALIEEHDLVGLLSPTDDWALAEGLIRAALLPDLPLHRLGALYNLLATVEWRRGRYDEARRHARQALTIAERVGDRLMEIKAVFNEATVESFTGNVGVALAGYERVLAMPEAFDTPRGRAATYSNVGCLYRAFLRLDDAVAAQRRAIEGFTGADYNLAIAWTSLGVAQVEQGAFDEAVASFTTAERHAIACKYTRGEASARIYAADARSLSGDVRAAADQVDRALPELARHEVVDLGNRESAARVFRRAGRFADAERQLELGLATGDDLPEVAGFLWAERARLRAALRDESGARDAIETARARFRTAGLDVRADELDVAEVGGGPLSAADRVAS